MYINSFALIIITLFVGYYLWLLQKRSDIDLEIINLILAVSHIEKSIDKHKLFKEQPHRYAFLLQYFLDMHNLKISALNKKWIAIYTFFYTRTSFSGSGTPIKYLKYGRIHPDTVIHIAEMYKFNAHGIGNGLWEESLYWSNRSGNEDLDKGEYHYPSNVKELEESIIAYDKHYIGDISMEKRSSHNTK